MELLIHRADTAQNAFTLKVCAGRKRAGELFAVNICDMGANLSGGLQAITFALSSPIRPPPCQAANSIF
jgi:hypothetical protein